MTRTEQHTPGPWRLILHGNERYPYPLSIHTEDGERWIARDGVVATVADAQLIAAAPRLLAALAAIASLSDEEVDEYDSRRARQIGDVARYAIECATATPEPIT